MKVDKTKGPVTTGRVARASGKAAGYGATVAPVTPVVSAAVLGIPEAEFTPRVRDAIMTLLHEVDRLKKEVEQTRARLADMSRTADQDVLLPILNRRAFVREIARFTSFTERYGTPSSLLYFDFDNFKQVNDSHGHTAGDAVLRHFADLVSRQIRNTDILARLGGDEFGVILAYVTADNAAKKGTSLMQMLRNHPPVWEGHTIALSFSFGVYELRPGENPDLAMRQADQAMYTQKRSER